MQRNIENLIISISDTLKNFTDGKLTLPEAKTAYYDLRGKYESIAKDREEPERGNQVEGICYYHNIENFAILSAIYGIDNNDIYELSVYGDKNINTRAMKKIFQDPGKAVKIEESKLIIIPPDTPDSAADTNSFLHNIYLYPVSTNTAGGDIKKIFASVSSSKYFSEEKFLFIGRLFKNIFSVLDEESRPVDINYFPAISSDIENFLKDNIDESHSVQMTLYVFNTLKTILSHMGMYTLFEASQEIYKTLKDNYRHNANSFVLSPSDYLSVKRINKNEFIKNKKDKLNFAFKNMNLPYHSLKLNIEKIDSMHSLWDQIMTFENYLATGDVVK